ncbi:MAG: branched-chain amino acid ABC transporter substrate-binding protein [Synergistaceae bacterium]|nr:branched-chain amino acid ABC transporter substrate-binding protein [Synergistaceae bacterium]
MVRKFRLLCMVLASVLLLGSAAGAAEKKVVKIGFLGPITGSNAAEGAAARNAFQLAIEEANKLGKYPYTIEVIEVDDQSSENVAVAGAQQIVSDSAVVAASGFWNSGPAAACIPVFKDAEIPLLIWGAIRETLTNAENVPYITRSAPTDKQENIPLALAVLDKMGYKDWFVVSDIGSYGDGNFNAFKAELAARAITPLGEEQVPEDATDLSAVAQKIKASGAKAVYCGSTVAIGSQLKRQLFEAGVRDVLFCGISGMKTDDFLKIGAPAAEGTLVVSPGIILEDSAEGRAFVSLYNSKKYTPPIGAFTPYAYEAALILLGALRACGDAPTAAAMTDAVLKSKTVGIMGVTTFNEIGQTQNVAAYLNVIQGGTWLPLEKSEYQSGKRKFGGK